MSHSTAGQNANGVGLPLVKCLVWDLDNTLWRGTLLEDEEVRLPDEIRRTVEELDARGILQSVASRNDHDLAWERLERLGIAEYFVLPQINWGRKSDSVRAIAEQLKFATSALAFIDDQPTERAEVEHVLPDVRTYEAGRAPLLTGLPEFSPARVTQDAANRRSMYQAGFRRERAEAEHGGLDDEFLCSLDLRLTIQQASEDQLARVEELTLRTSQMNATGVHYSEGDLRALLDDPAHDVLVAGLTDRFGDHGAIGVVLLERLTSHWHVKLLATSCRVVSFGTGATILRWLKAQARAAGVHLTADFRPTDRNRIMEVAYRFAGFSQQPCVECADLGEGGPGVQRLHCVPASEGISETMRVIAPTLGAPAAESVHECYGYRVECSFDSAARPVVEGFFGPAVDRQGAVGEPVRTIRLSIAIQDGPMVVPVNPPHNLEVMTSDPIVIDTASSRCVFDPSAGAGTITLARADIDDSQVWGRWMLERLFLYLICRSPRSYPLHAGAIEVDGRVAVLTAAAGVGKSTFTYWALHRGAKLVGEDILARNMDEPGAVVWGYPRALYVTPEMIARADLLQDAQATPIEGGAKSRVTVPRSLEDRLLSRARPSCMVFLVRGDGRQEVRELSASEALDRCREDYATAKSEADLKAVEDDLRGLLSGAPVWEFEVSGDLDESYDRLRAALARLPVPSTD
ncbi:HAD-IIIC family phosphatase [Streptomyces sp. PTM05]|uniref:HAD-IIIC family phosphatase n=2 Tax=Streptantibioticus parmotrematis TaxID=2873249 RepID=A0ABS7QSF7_9ACTN|nr:HAD-IIIC family phosphatase [Streptantibioticus parmotrematis]